MPNVIPRCPTDARLLGQLLLAEQRLAQTTGEVRNALKLQESLVLQSAAIADHRAALSGYRRTLREFGGFLLGLEAPAALEIHSLNTAPLLFAPEPLALRTARNPS